MRTSQLGLSGNSDNAVFVNDHLTINNKKLFSKALALKKEFKWRYLWTDKCRTEARKTEDSKVFSISSDSDLRVFAYTLTRQNHSPNVLATAALHAIALNCRYQSTAQ